MLFPDYRKPLRPRAGQCHGKLSKSEPAATTDQKYIHTGPELQTTLTSWEIPASGTTGIYDCFQEWPVTINDWNWISTKCICYNSPVSVSCKSRMIDQVLLESEKSSFTNIPHTLVGYCREIQPKRSVFLSVRIVGFVYPLSHFLTIYREISWQS